MPAMAAYGMPSASARSIHRSRPPNATASASSSRRGRPSARAARLAVPSGTMASGTVLPSPVPASPVPASPVFASPVPRRPGGPGQCLGAAADGAVTTGRHDQPGAPGGRLPGQAQAVTAAGGLEELHGPAAGPRGLAACPPEPGRVADPQPVDDDRGGWHREAHDSVAVWRPPFLLPSWPAMREPDTPARRSSPRPGSSPRGRSTCRCCWRCCWPAACTWPGCGGCAGPASPGRPCRGGASIWAGWARWSSRPCRSSACTRTCCSTSARCRPSCCSWWCRCSPRWAGR